MARHRGSGDRGRLGLLAAGAGVRRFEPRGTGLSGRWEPWTCCAFAKSEDIGVNEERAIGLKDRNVGEAGFEGRWNPVYEVA